MNITDEGAMRLLEALCKSSCTDLEGGVRDYLDAVEAENLLVNRLASAIEALNQAEKVTKEIIANYMAARVRKNNAARVVKKEIKFLNSEEYLDLPVAPVGKEAAIYIVGKILSDK